MEINQVTCFLSLGSNIGDSISLIENAIEMLDSEDTAVIQTSSFYESDPWGFESNNIFINCCVQISTKKSLEELLSLTQSIERKIGRIEKSINSLYVDRIIDVDILFFGNKISNSNIITVPHPLFHERNFVLIPLAEIAPNLINPINNLTITQHLINSKDNNSLKAVKKS